MLGYNANLKDKARQLRKNMTDSEKALWSRLRNRQLLGIQFYRQKPIGEHIVDFFAPRVKLVVEVDGSQHMVGDHVQKDRIRDGYLASLGLKVLRFHSREVLKESDAVVEAIYRMITEQLNAKIPPGPPLKKRGIKGKTSKLALMPLWGEGRVRVIKIRPSELNCAWGLNWAIIIDSFVKSSKMSHCERSEAILYFLTH